MMIEFILIFPLLSCIALIFFKNKTLSSCLLIINAIALLIASVTLCYALNNGIKIPSLVGHYFKVDDLNILFFLVLATVFLAVAIYSSGYVKAVNMHNKKATYYSVGILLFVFSMTGAVLSSNMALSWVFLEATSLTSAYLIYFEKTKQSLEATWKYVFICSIGISLGFVGIILLTASLPSINSLFFKDLYANPSLFNHLWLNIGFVFFLIGIGTKAGLAPVHSWLPDAHSEAPSPVSALLSGVLLNTALLLILRYFHILNIAECASYGKFLLICMGILSIFITCVFVLRVKNYKRMLAYSSIENMGIIAIGVGIGGIGVYASLIHLIFHSLAKSSFFMTSGNILIRFRSKRIDNISEIVRSDSYTAWLWMLCFVAIAGIPPSPLFISEFLIIKALFEAKHYLIILIFVILIAVIIFGIARSVINMSFGKSAKMDELDIVDVVKFSWTMYLPQTILLIILAISGVYLWPFISTMIKNAASLI
ncbi:MAG: proton-conducting transporter membrane subunit [Lentisphaerota bacterium]